MSSKQGKHNPVASMKKLNTKLTPGLSQNFLCYPLATHILPSNDRGVATPVNTYTFSVV